MSTGAALPFRQPSSDSRNSSHMRFRRHWSSSPPTSPTSAVCDSPFLIAHQGRAGRVFGGDANDENQRPQSNEASKPAAAAAKPLAGFLLSPLATFETPPPTPPPLPKLLLRQKSTGAMAAVALDLLIEGDAIKLDTLKGARSAAPCLSCNTVRRRRASRRLPLACTAHSRRRLRPLRS